MSVTLLIVDLWQNCVCCIRSGVTLCTLLIVLYLDRMCQCGYTRCSGCNRYAHAPPRRRTSQYRRIFIPLSVSLWTDFAELLFNGVGLEGFRSRANDFIGLSAVSQLYNSTRYCGAEFFGRTSLSLSLALPTSFNSNNNNEKSCYWILVIF